MILLDCILLHFLAHRFIDTGVSEKNLQTEANTGADVLNGKFTIEYPFNSVLISSLLCLSLFWE